MLVKRLFCAVLLLIESVVNPRQCEKREFVAREIRYFKYSQQWPIFTTTNSFDDYCLRLKICSLNQEDLCSIPVGFT